MKLKKPIITFLFLLLVLPISRAEERLNYKNTFALIVGVLHWEDEARFSSYSKEKRKDQELFERLVLNGMPRNQGILLLDEDATLEGMGKALDCVLKMAGEDSTLIFYYAGHGTRSGDPYKYYFANVDMRGVKNGFCLDDLGDKLVKGFKGNCALFFADCCHSGGLEGVVEKLALASIQSASITSVIREQSSTNNWTFSQTLIQGLCGDPLFDSNRDGWVDLSEMAYEVRKAMQYLEGQKSGYSIKPLGDAFQLTKRQGEPKNAKSKHGFSVGEYVKANSKGRWTPARVVGFEEDRYRVRFYSYNATEDRLLKAQGLKKISYLKYAPGEEVGIPLSGHVAQGVVIEIDGDFLKIRYKGWSEKYDEWRLADRVNKKKPDASAKPSALVEWHGQWYPAVVLKKKEKKYLIHYVGYSDSWDEWVTEDRIKLDKK